MVSIPDGTTPKDIMVSVEELVTRRLYIQVQEAFSVLDYESAPERISVERIFGSFVKDMVYSLRMAVAGDRVETNVEYVVYPDDWWEAFKARWFSDWMLKRWPVRKTERKIVTQTIMRVCPHVGFNPKEKHLHWLLKGNG